MSECFNLYNHNKRNQPLATVANVSMHATQFGRQYILNIT